MRFLYPRIDGPFAYRMLGLGVLLLALASGEGVCEPINTLRGFGDTVNKVLGQLIATASGAPLSSGGPFEPPPQPISGNKSIEFDETLPIKSSVERIWEVLTDYENIETFQPGIEKSGLLPPFENGDKRLEQEMVQGFLFFKKRLRLVLRIVESPQQRADFSLIEGDFHRYEGAWIIDDSQAEVRLRLILRIEPAFSAPSPILNRIVRNSCERSLQSVIEEAYRRSR